MTNVSNLRTGTLWKIRGKDSWEKISKSKFLKSEHLWFKYYLEDSDQNTAPQIAIAVSRKYGNAVKRNRFKRRVKSALRDLILNDLIPRNIVLLIGINHTNLTELSYSDIQKSLKNLSEMSLQ